MTTPPLSVHSVSLAMLLADARLPSGGHVHSAGLEPALLSKMPLSDVRSLLRTRGRTTTLVEAGTAVVARHVTLMDEDLASVVSAWAARTPSAAQRDAARLLGRGYLRVALRLWPHAPRLRALHLEAAPLPRAVVLGVAAAEGGMEAEDLVRMLIYEEAACAAAAVLKLEPCDPLDAISWVLDTCAAIDPFVDDIASITTPSAIPAASAPRSEEWAEAHALLTQRLFRA